MTCVSVILYTNAIHMRVFGFNETYLYMDKFGKANEKLYFFILFIYFANEKF